MDTEAKDLDPRDLVDIVEHYGPCGGWTWSLASNQQTWSPGFFRILGLQSHGVTASYGLFRDLVHPDDRHHLPAPGEIAQGKLSPPAIVRVIKPSGEMGTLAITSDLRVSPDGRPLTVVGCALDVTDRERLRQRQAATERQRRTLYLASYTASFSVGLDFVHEFPPEMARVHGPSLQEISIDPFIMIVPDEREAFLHRHWDMYSRQLRFQGKAQERLVNGEVLQFRIIGAPVWDTNGSYIGGIGVKYPILRSGTPVRDDAPSDPRLRRALEQTLRGHHVRAARGLLDWSMSTLAEASGLSISTVRRLEEDAEGPGARSRHTAVDALRKAGIRFIALDDGTIALSKA